MRSQHTGSTLSQLVSPSANPRSLRAALRSWGLHRASNNFAFTKRTLTTDRVDYENVVFWGGSNKATLIERLVVTRNTALGAKFGEFTIEAGKVSTASGITIGRVSAVGIRGANNLADVFAAISTVTSVPLPSTPAQLATSFESLSLTDMAVNRSPSSTNSNVTIGEITLSGPIFDGALRTLTGLSVRNFVGGDSNYQIKLGSLEVTEASDQTATLLRALSDGTSPFINFLAHDLGTLSVKDVAVSAKHPGRSSALTTFGIENFRLSNVKQGVVDQFVVSGFKMAGLVARQPIELSLASVGVSGINLAYFSELGNYFKASMPAVMGGRKANAPAPPTQPRRVFADLLKGGPLDGGFTGLDLADFRMSAGGIVLDLDKIQFLQQRNSAGIVTRADMEPTQVRVSWADMASAAPARMALLTEQLGASDIVMRVSFKSSFAPETDVMTLESYKFELIDWGRLDMGMTLSGLSAFLVNTSFSDLLEMTSVRSPQTGASSRAMFADLMKLYKNISINSARLEIVDFGGLDKAARISTTMTSRPNRPSSTNQALNSRDIRAAWAQEPRNMSGNKSKPALERMFGLGVARWLEDGGTLNLIMTPPMPLNIADFSSESKITPQSIGLRIINQPAAR